MRQVNEWIEAVAKDQTFADVGGLWGTENEKVSVASKAGAREVTMIDITPIGSRLWQCFDERCAAAGVSGCRRIAADINDTKQVDEIGSYEVAHCSGVLYHCPDPLHAVLNLAKLSCKVLILGSAVVPSKIENASGTLSIEPGSALFVPALNESQKAVIGRHFTEVGAQEIIGITTPCQYSVNDYGPWWWLFSREYVAALLQVAGFTILATGSDWEHRTALYMAQNTRALGI
ncbi:MAG: hypothetical protein ACREQW_19170 [Candidatus Binatia bacterium]